MHFGDGYYSLLSLFSEGKIDLPGLGWATGEDTRQAHRLLAYFPSFHKEKDYGIMSMNLSSPFQPFGGFKLCMNILPTPWEPLTWDAM
jgi:hypothetical protein